MARPSACSCSFSTHKAAARPSSLSTRSRNVRCPGSPIAWACRRVAGPKAYWASNVTRCSGYSDAVDGRLASGALALVHPARGAERIDERIDLVGRVVDVEAGAQGRRDVQRAVQRLAAMVPG